jgi:uncharacterized protein (DUF2147 family)
MKILKETTQEILVKDLKDGEIAVVTQWFVPHYIGLLVQRYGDHLVTLGSASSKGWTEFFIKDFSTGQFYNCKVRVLPKGTQIEI